MKTKSSSKFASYYSNSVSSVVMFAFRITPNFLNGFCTFLTKEDPLTVFQDYSKTDNNVIGKDWFRMKLPLLVTGIAIAAVGVAVASIGRSH